MKKIFSVLFLCFIFVFLFLFLFVKKSYAGCTGVTTCHYYSDCSWSLTGIPCDPDEVGDSGPQGICGNCTTNDGVSQACSSCGGSGCYEFCGTIGNPFTPSSVCTFVTSTCQVTSNCGNGTCDAEETCANCSSDCFCSTCGNSICDGTETTCTCNQDCPGTCVGVTECQANGGSCMAAAADCGVYGMSTGTGSCDAGEMCCTATSGWSSCIPNYDNPPGCAKIGEGHYPPGHCNEDGHDCYWPTNCYAAEPYHGSDCIWDFTCCQGLEFAATTCQCPVPTCTPNCPTACGQDDGCGTACSNAATGIPSCAVLASTTPYYDPSTGLVTITWSDDNKADLYNVIVYPEGSTKACPPVNSNAYCTTTSAKSFSFYPNPSLGSDYSVSVQGVNTSCGTEANTCSSIDFTIYAPVDVEFHEETTSTCSENNPVIPGSPGNEAVLNLNDGMGFSTNQTISTTTARIYGPYWPFTGNYELILTPGYDTVANWQWQCICPDDCRFSGISTPGVTTYKYYLSNLDLTHRGWFQTMGGNIYADRSWPANAISDPVPADTCTTSAICDPYMIDQDINNNDASAGFAITGGGSIDSHEDDGEQESNITFRSTQVRVIGNSFEKVNENYKFFAQRMGLGANPADNSSDFGDASNNALKPNVSRSFYYVPGNMRINSPWSVGVGESYVIFVENNLLIDDDSNVHQLINVDEGGFLAFIVGGHINIGAGVGNDYDYASTQGNIEGVYVADGHISIASKTAVGGGDERFVGEGIFVGWSGISLERDFDDTRIGRARNNDKAVELFIYRPDLLFFAPEAMKMPRMLWQETT